MAKKESTIVNMVLTLSIITLISATVLGLLNEATKEPIRLAKEKKKQEAIKIVVPEFDNNPTVDTVRIKTPSGKDFLCYTAKKGDEVVGYAIASSTTLGYSGYIGIMVGLLPDGTIHNTSVIQHMETPGLGTKMAEKPFQPQFEGKNPATFKLVVKKDGGDVDAISGATVSSAAYCDALQSAYDAYTNDLKK